jgi:uncharacterized membrane protein
MLERTRAIVSGLAAGAGLMYMLDPDRGRRRRAHVRDKAAHLRRQTDRAVGVTSRDIKHRAEGFMAGTRSRLRSGSAPDDVLEARVRTELGRLVSHPGSIEVEVADGNVMLEGPVLSREMHRLVSGVKSVRGVKTVDNRLEVFEHEGDIPGLQGGVRREGHRPELLQTNWAPAPRLLAGSAGAVLFLRGLGRRGLTGFATAGAGLALLLRAATNLELKRLTGFGAGRRAVEIRKDVNVDAPVDEVFGFWSNVDNIPRFMSHVKEVRRLDDGRTHWVAEGRGGLHVEWDAETTVFKRNELIGWRSVNGAAVQNAGLVRFQPNEKGGTRVTIQLSYNPPLGAVGHALASMIGTDPRHLLHEDMVRFKSLVEGGKTTVDGRTVTRDDLRVEH